VLKANIGCGGATVWCITFAGNKEWKSHLIAGKLKNWPEPRIYEGECWLPTAPKEETHTFATFIECAQILYSARTRAGPDGITKYAGVDSGTGINKGVVQGLVDEAFKCL
jgi:hypothetical protein